MTTSEFFSWSQVWSITVQPFCLRVTPTLPMSELLPQGWTRRLPGLGRHNLFWCLASGNLRRHRTTLPLCFNSEGNLYQTI